MSIYESQRKVQEKKALNKEKGVDYNPSEMYFSSERLSYHFISFLRCAFLFMQKELNFSTYESNISSSIIFVRPQCSYSRN